MARQLRSIGRVVSIPKSPNHDLSDLSFLSQVPLSRKFRALKVWLMMRAFGLDKVREHIRNHTKLAREFAAMVETDER